MTGAAFLIAAGQSLGLTRRVQVGQGLRRRKIRFNQRVGFESFNLFIDISNHRNIIFLILFNINFDNNFRIIYGYLFFTQFHLLIMLDLLYFRKILI